MSGDGFPGANILLAYFHYCNKGEIKQDHHQVSLGRLMGNTGIYPFSAECKDQDLSTLAELDENKIGFITVTRRAVDNHSKEPFPSLVAEPFCCGTTLLGDGNIEAKTGVPVWADTNLLCSW